MAVVQEELEQEAPAKKGKKGKKGKGDGEKKKGKKGLIIKVVGALFVLFAVKTFVLGGGGKPVVCPEAMAWADKYVGTTTTEPAPAPAPAAKGKAAQTTTTTADACAPAEGEVYNTADPVTLNLADGRFAKFKLALQLTATANLEAMGKGDQGAKAKQVAIDLLTTKTYDDLQNPDKLHATEVELSRKVAAAYDKEVMGVYFIDLVKQ
ncbi:MAG: flagellar basal body-associated FliL family protein [Acidimicrobiia bacterium]